MIDPISVLSVLGGVAVTTRNIAPRSAARVEQTNNPKPLNLFARSDSVELSIGAREHANLDQAKQLTESEKEEVRKLQQRDTEVRAHEQSHRAAGGQYAGAVSLDYTRGPDGNNYATEGSVPIDLSAVKDDPAATIRKMQQIKRAALAPGDPSGADRQIASQAAQIEQQAQAELRETKNQQVNTNDSAAQDPNEDIAQDVSSLLAKATNPYTIAAGAVKQLTAPRFVNVFA
ncbi:MAG: hypothetical protein IH984_17235 [Planctomycetes bacterium]|nr:hypothetical protein [Planctomycetota bacterium]